MSTQKYYFCMNLSFLSKGFHNFSFYFMLHISSSSLYYNKFSSHLNSFFLCFPVIIFTHSPVPGTTLILPYFTAWIISLFPSPSQQFHLTPFIRTMQMKDTFVHICVCAQSCLTLCDPMDCSPPGFSVSSVSCIGRQVLYPEPLGSPT